jgi:hypothetical protein
VLVVSVGSPAARASEPSRAAASKSSIYIPAPKVLCLALQGTQPSGRPTPARGKRPAGVAVYGVTGLGVGVKDGDVITEIMGQPVHSVAQGIALIIAARAARQHLITGTLWRATRAMSIAVEQPYTVSDCDEQDADCWKSRCSESKKSKPRRAPPKPSASAQDPKR